MSVVQFSYFAIVNYAMFIICIIICMPYARPCRSIILSVSPSTSPTYVPSSNATMLMSVVQYSYFVIVNYAMCVICMPYARPCRSIILSVSLSTSPTHVPSSNATLLISVVQCSYIAIVNRDIDVIICMLYASPCT